MTALEDDLRKRAKAIAAEANECCNRSDGYEEEIEDLALQHLAAVAAPQSLMGVQRSADINGAMEAALEVYGKGARIGETLHDFISRVVVAALPPLRAREEIDALVKFARWAISEGPWQGNNLDGGSVQDMAEKLGLLTKTKYDPAIHSDSEGVCEPGDDWFVFSDALSRTAGQEWREPEGWQLVPKEPTDEMITAARVVRDTALSDLNSIATYHAMLAACPAPPVEPKETP